MKARITAIVWLIFQTGCSSIQWTGQCGTITRTGFATDIHLQSVTVEIDADCAHRISFGAADSNQSEALKAVAEGAVKGAIKGAAP